MIYAYTLWTWKILGKSISLEWDHVSAKIPSLAWGWDILHSEKMLSSHYLKLYGNIFRKKQQHNIQILSYSLIQHVLVKY